MKIFVRTLKGTHFEIEVKPDDTVVDVKKNIETVQGSDVYPAAQQMLIHQGKVLKDETTLEENKVAEKSFVVIMLSKNKASSSGAATASAPPASTTQPASNTPPPTQPVTAAPTPASAIALPQSVPESAPVPAPTPASSVTDVYGQAASNLVAGSNLEVTIQQILDMGGGSWDRDTVVRALRAAYNNPERAVEYLYSGIPEQAEVAPVAQPPAGGQHVNPSTQATQLAVPSSGPNANPLDLFPQGLPNMGSNASAGTLVSSTESHLASQTSKLAAYASRARKSKSTAQMIQGHQADFLRIINEPVEGEGEEKLEREAEISDAHSSTKGGDGFCCDSKRSFTEMSIQDDDKVAWGHQRESFFIDLLVDEIRKGNLTSSTFHNRTWTQIEAHMHAKYSKTYPVSKLKQKFQRLRAKWKTFRELKGNTGFGWDDALQTVTASDRIWKEEIAKNKDAGQFRKKGCDDFDKLTEIFGDSTATGDLTRASTQGPLNSDEEQEVEEVYIHGSNSSHQDISMNDSEDVEVSKLPSSARKDKKRGNTSAFIPSASSNVVDEAWMAFKNAQESKKAMFDRTKGEVKARDCIQIIESMNDIPEDQFVKACTEFKDSSMRDMFVAMSDTRRRQWLRSLTR